MRDLGRCLAEKLIPFQYFEYQIELHGVLIYRNTVYYPLKISDVRNFKFFLLQNQPLQVMTFIASLFHYVI